MDKSNVLWSHEDKDHPDRKIDGFKINIVTKLITKYFTQGPAYLKDVRYIEGTWGFPGNFSYATEYLDFELYVYFIQDVI